MSYAKVKYITRKPKEGKIYITSAENNLRPLTYRKWELMENNGTYHDKMLDLMRAINGGGLVLNDSMYDWNYALIKTNGEMRAKYGETYQGLYESSSIHFTIYCIGEKWRDDYISITADDLKNGEYVLNYESKDGRVKHYYRAEEYNKEKARTRAILEEYLGFFEKYLDEKIEGKYYLYNKKYGYVLPKGSNKFYHSQYSSLYTEKDLMDYKQAYCKAQIVGKETEIRAVPTREYEPTKAQLDEGKKRLELIGINADTSKLYVSSKYNAILLQGNEFELIDEVNNFEKEHNTFVYHIIQTYTNFGECYSMLYVSNNQDEWVGDYDDLKNNECYAYVWNKSDHICSEIGLIGIDTQYNNLVVRTF